MDLINLLLKSNNYEELTNGLIRDKKINRKMIEKYTGKKYLGENTIDEYNKSFFKNILNLYKYLVSEGYQLGTSKTIDNLRKIMCKTQFDSEILDEYPWISPFILRIEDIDNQDKLEMNIEKPIKIILDKYTIPKQNTLYQDRINHFLIYSSILNLIYLYETKNEESGKSKGKDDSKEKELHIDIKIIEKIIYNYIYSVENFKEIEQEFGVCIEIDMEHLKKILEKYCEEEKNEEKS